MGGRELVKLRNVLVMNVYLQNPHVVPGLADVYSTSRMSWQIRK